MQLDSIVMHGADTMVSERPGAAVNAHPNGRAMSAAVSVAAQLRSSG